MNLPVTLVQGAYIVAGLLFILALAGLSKHESARMGNRYGVIGMAEPGRPCVTVSSRSFFPESGVFSL